jgi:hypothetical protein
MTFAICRIVGGVIHWYTPSGNWDSSMYAAARLSQSSVDVIAELLRDHYGEEAVRVMKSPIS